MRRLVAAGVLVAVVGTASPLGAGADGWRPSRRAAIRWAADREGRVRFAVVDDDGRLYRYLARTEVPMASLLKVMLMTAYLRHGAVRDRNLRERDRDLLAPMIRWSDNATASAILDFVGDRAVRRLARRAGMRRFRLRDPWGLSLTSARDQARFMWRLERYIPPRHRGYARRLLRTIVRSQRWGIAAAVPDGWTIHFKGGWGSGTGRVTHQVAFLESGDRRVAVAILTEFSPSHRYGTRTVRGVARRLLRGL